MVNWGQTRHGDGDDAGGIPAIRQKITMICLRRIDMKPKEIAVGLQGAIVEWWLGESWMPATVVRMAAERSRLYAPESSSRVTA